MTLDTAAPLKSGWRRVKFGDVVRLSKARSQNPLADGLERYVGLEHLEPGDLRIRSWGNVADGTTFTNRFEPGQVLFGKPARISARWRWRILPACARATSTCWRARTRTSCCRSCCRLSARRMRSSSMRSGRRRGR